MRNVLLVSISLLVGTAWIPAFADHFGPTNPFNIPRAPAPMPTAPVAAPAPAPAAATPAPPAPQATLLNIPILTPNVNIVLPTDASGNKVPVRVLLPKPKDMKDWDPPLVVVPPDFSHPNAAKSTPIKPPANWNKPDLRFDFSNHSWIGFEPDSTPTGEATATEKDFTTAGYEASVSITDQVTPKALANGAFIPTTTTKIDRLEKSSLRLRSGAILVRAANKPLTVHTGYGGSDASVTVSGRSLALISLYDNKLLIMNLTDNCCGSVKADLPGKQSKQTLTVESGQILECYTDKQQPNSNWVAVNILVNDRVSQEHCLLVCRVNYIRALKKYQIAQVLPKQEMDRVLKTAAAMVSLGK